MRTTKLHSTFVLEDLRGYSTRELYAYVREYEALKLSLQKYKGPIGFQDEVRTELARIEAELVQRACKGGIGLGVRR